MADGKITDGKIRITQADPECGEKRGFAEASLRVQKSG